MSEADKPKETLVDGKTTVNWDDSRMQTTYANVVNAASTREEVSLFFGTNQTWNLQEGKEVTIQLSDRIVLNPYAAKRLLMLLNGIMQQYEKKFGVLHIDLNQPPQDA